MNYVPLTKDQYQKAIDSGYSHDDIINFEQKRKADENSKGFFTATQPTAEDPYKTGSALTSPLLSYTPYGKNDAWAGTKNIAKAVVNAPTSALRFGKAMVDPRTSWNLGKALAGGIQSIPGVEQLYAKSPFQTATGKETLESNKAAFQGLKTSLYNMFGTKENISRSLVEGPVETVATARGLTETAGVGLKLAGATKAGEAVSGAAEMIGTKALSEMTKSILENNPEAMDSFIKSKFTKGVRPSVSGKASDPQLQVYQNKAVGAVKTIADNKNNLKITDEFGEPTKTLPQNLNQFSQAISQTKKIIFDQYDAMQKAAGEKGTVVPLDTVVTELQKIANDPVMTDTQPTVAKYAKDMAKTFTERKSYTTEQAQQATETYNKSLEAFYKNPTYETASKAAVDSLIVNNLRKGLDNVIESAEGPGYQELKNKYGSLKAIEKDVVHRAMIDARKNAKGLIDFTDIFSAGELVNGLVNLSPGGALKAGGMFALKSYIKFLNNPNTAIKQMFNSVEKYGGTTTPAVPPTKVK